MALPNQFQTIDIDLAGASMATNGEYVLIGAPASDRAVSPSRDLAGGENDDAGAVLVYRIVNGSPVEFGHILGTVVEVDY